MSFHGQVGKVIGQTSVYLAKLSYVWGLPHVYEVNMFTLHGNRYTYLELSSWAYKLWLRYF